ncbi:phosphoribosylaminoimidazole carboxylase [Mycena indigotica]|uniref:Phosphoribosylaminoimidazole carboxylase n=1 Tax=Mycena indigotica TaxID=2126181 RepID=A0A8H6TFR2_9AGAR|nr:phosphoribosylaminoimidazole carboxylase [Mycena indigotica]KAF7315922.1 phosphoribosylaminoimidazole carboxylase [Mycena indigotica]
MRLSLAAVVALSIRLCAAAIFENVADLQQSGSSFDFIILVLIRATGGTSGAVLANRLSENSAFSVLLLEAGGSYVQYLTTHSSLTYTLQRDADIINLSAPLLCILATPFTQQDWNFTTVPQAALNNRVIPYPRGFVLGGTSSVNFMAYTRGSKEDFDRFANLVNDQRWSWNSLVPYWKKSEKLTPPVDNHNTSKQVDASVHGLNGLNSITVTGFPTEIDSKVIATTQVDSQFPFNLDMNSGNPLGVGWAQMTVLNGQRSSAATSYLASSFVARPNLKILLHARVTRVLPTATNDFRTVQFQDRQGNTFNLTANKEVILSAGSVSTPPILMHSGIGDFATLTSLAITPSFPLTFSVNSNSNGTFDPIFQNPTTFTQSLTQWSSAGTAGTGRMGAEPISHMAWLRVPSTASIFASVPDPAAGSNTPHLELLITNGWVGLQAPPTSGHYMGVAVAVVSPTSRGTITISSNDPLAPPVIDPNFFHSEIDKVFMRAAVRAAFRFAFSQPFADYVVAATTLNGFTLTSTSSDEEIDAYVRQNCGTVFHPVGTAAMSPVGADYGVVDPDLKVKGLTGLRIVDLSVMPIVPAAHTQAAAYVIGERAADIIKASW